MFLDPSFFERATSILGPPQNGLGCVTLPLLSLLCPLPVVFGPLLLRMRMNVSVPMSPEVVCHHPAALLASYRPHMALRLWARNHWAGDVPWVALLGRPGWGCCAGQAGKGGAVRAGGGGGGESSHQPHHTPAIKAQPL